MKKFCRIADKFGVRIILKPEPMNDKPKSVQQLINFYTELGFTGDESEMARSPQHKTSVDFSYNPS